MNNKHEHEFVGELTIQELMEELLKELIKSGKFNINELSKE